jgi:hypothetical protein
MMTPTTALHEDLRRDDDVAHGSDRAFGLVFAGVFAIVGVIGWWRTHQVRGWALWVSLAFFVVALTVPRGLAPLNFVWSRFGLLLHKITSPIILGLMYAIAIVPVGLLMRLSGRDPMQRRFDPALKSYWIERSPPGPSPDSVTRQY